VPVALLRVCDSHVIEYRSQSNEYLHTVALRLRDCSPNPPAVIDDLSMNFIDDKIERAEIAVVEVFAQFQLFFFFFLTPTNSQTSSRDYCMPISSASAIWLGRVHNHAQRRHIFNLPKLSPFTPSLPGLEPQTYHERKTLPSV
jgi:hypothetical protein